jgi:hypothetical protein
MFVSRFIAIGSTRLRAVTNSDPSATIQPSHQDDIKILQTSGEKKLWQRQSFMERIRGRRFFAA